MAEQNQINIWSSYDPIWNETKGSKIWPYWQKRAQELVAGRTNTGFQMRALLIQYVRAQDAEPSKEAIFLWVMSFTRDLQSLELDPQKQFQDYSKMEQFYFDIMKKMHQDSPDLVESSLIKVILNNPIQMVLLTDAERMKMLILALRALKQSNQISATTIKELMRFKGSTKDLEVRRGFAALAEVVPKESLEEFNKFLVRIRATD